ncbi:MAG: hypothetical protein SGBAC_010387 [Bacillariaceae sp.]
MTPDDLNSTESDIVQSHSVFMLHLQTLCLDDSVAPLNLPRKTVVGSVTAFGIAHGVADAGSFLITPPEKFSTLAPALRNRLWRIWQYLEATGQEDVVVSWPEMFRFLRENQLLSKTLPTKPIDVPVDIPTSSSEEANEPMKTNASFGKEFVTQTDWSQPIQYPLSRRILLLLLSVCTTTVYFHGMASQSVPFFSDDLMNGNSTGHYGSMTSTEKLKKSHMECLEALCEVSETINFECEVNPAGTSAHMIQPQEPDFMYDVPIPKACQKVFELAIGKETYNDFINSVHTSLNVVTFSLVHFLDTNGWTKKYSEEVQKGAIVQVVPDQCALRYMRNHRGDQLKQGTIDFKTTWLAPFGSSKPGEIVNFNASNLMCYKNLEGRIDTQYWSEMYNNLLDNRSRWLGVAVFCCAAMFETGRAIFYMIRLLPLTFCLVYRPGAGDDIKFGTVWKIVVSLFSIVQLYIDNQHLLVCLLAGASMMLYQNTKAAIELGFLYALSLLEGWAPMQMVSSALLPLDSLLGYFIPSSGLVWKLAMVYMVYMTIEMPKRRKTSYR